MPSNSQQQQQQQHASSRSGGGHHQQQRDAAPPGATHRSRHTTRRIGEQDGRPFTEVVETTEEVTTRAYPPSSQASRASVQPHQEYPRLAFQGNDRASRRNQSSPTATATANTSGRGTPRSGAPPSSNRYMSVTNRGAGTPRGGAHAHTPSNSQQRDARHPTRASGLVESPANVTALDDYDTPPRQRRSDGYYGYDHGNGYNAAAPRQNGHHRNSTSTATAETSDPRANARPRPGSFVANATHADIEVEDDEVAQTGPFHFRVRVHDCRGIFADLEEAHRAAPAVYFALHTAEKRGHTGVTEPNSFNPVFNDEFTFTSADPERDALVCTLVAVGSSSQRRDKKVAECVLALHNLAWKAERMMWVPLVRHPGTEQAYEQGEVRISVFSEDFGYDEVASAESETTCATAIHDTLLRYAPKELHRLNWLTAAYVDKGPEAWDQLKASYRARTMEPVPVRVTLQRVDGLTDDAGRPIGACDVYVVVSDGHTERQSKTAPYRHRATFNQDFNLTLANPEVDTISVSVYGKGRKLGEAVAGLTNVKAGEQKDVTLMLVRAAETGDASNGGQVQLTLLTQKYSSPYSMTPAQEAQLRNRVLNYLWCYLRDDLHRLDAIVGSVDNEEVYMREWVRTIGPERTPKRLSVNVRGASDIGADNNGMPPRCYARVCVGPETQRTELAISRNGGVAFKTPVQVHVYDPAHDAIEVMLIADNDDGEREISRVTFGVANMPKARRVVRSLHLTADATKRSARLQGEVTVELVAEDFGLVGMEADAAIARIYSASSPHVQRLEGITLRGSPEKLHRVPYMLDTAPPDEVERVVEQEAKQNGSDVAVAPMTVKILGVKAFKPASDFYVKAYLNNEPILRTGDVKGATEATLGIENDNEQTMRLGNAAQSVITFKVAHHRALLKPLVYGEAEVALSTLVRGEKNTLWLPFFRTGGTSGKSSAGCATSNPDKSVKVKGNRMPQTNNGNAAATSQLAGGDAAQADPTLGRHGGVSPVGLLGVELRSMAFPNTTVTVYKVKGENGTKSVPAQTVVTRDVTSLVAKMRPSDLPKVQPMIAQCSSLKDAHAELRAQLSPVPIAGTVYVHVESVELISAEGQTQEAQGGIAVEASFGDERQVARKRMEAAGDALHQRLRYSEVRLDIPESALSNTAGSGPAASAERLGVPALQLRLVGAQTRDRAVSGSPARGAGADTSAVADAQAAAGGAPRYHHDAGNFELTSDHTADSYYVGGENNIHSYLKSPKHHSHHWDIKQPSGEQSGRPSKMLLSQQQQHEQMQSQSVSPSRGASPGRVSLGARMPWQSTSAFSNATYYANNTTANNNASGARQQSQLQGDGQEREYSERYYPGGVNNIRSYADSPGRSASRQQSPQRQDDSYFVNRNASPSPASASTAPYAIPYRGEIGLVRLSLRALLTAPLYKIGDTLRVPIVAPTLVSGKLSYHARHSAEVNQRCVVGHVTLRLSLPAFEHIPEPLRLGSRHMMSKVVPDYVHYYERRIGAYLRANNAPDLVSFHFNLYERDIASGNWPVSLYDWMQALIKAYGPETANFGPEPPLPFDPEEWERARLADKALRSEWEATFATSEKGGAAHPDSINEEGLYSARDSNPSASASPSRGAISVRRHSKEPSRAPADATYSF